MIVMTTILTGLTTAMLRSATALILVAFMIFVAFAVAYLFFGTGLFSLLMSIAGFNAGLVLFAAAHVFGAHPHSR
jgi:hypothetical protein